MVRSKTPRCRRAAAGCPRTQSTRTSNASAESFPSSATAFARSAAASWSNSTQGGRHVARAACRPQCRASGWPRRRLATTARGPRCRPYAKRRDGLSVASLRELAGLDAERCRGPVRRSSVASTQCAMTDSTSSRCDSSRAAASPRCDHGGGLDVASLRPLAG